MEEYRGICEIVPGALADSARVRVSFHTCPTCYAAVQADDIPAHSAWHMTLRYLVGFDPSSVATNMTPD